MSRKLNTEKFLQKLSKKGITHLEPLTEYEGTRIKMKFRCKRCNSTFWNTPNKVLMRGTCTKCSKKGPRLTNEEIQLRLDKKYTNGEYTLLSDYEGNTKPITVRHNSEKCGNYVFTKVANYILNGKGCPVCIDNRWNTFRLKEHLANNLPYLELITENITHENTTINSRVLVKDTRCNHTNSYSVQYLVHTFKENISCKQCKLSLPVIAIREWLEENNIPFNMEVNFPELVYLQPLYFDFVIWDENDNALLAIEYDGKQHFEPIKFYNITTSFEEIQNRDKIKNNFCKNNNLELIRFSYKDTIEDILKTLEHSLLI